jgi:ADP-ribose pyrophosphatase YjhB (NUDIX family)
MNRPDSPDSPRSAAGLPWRTRLLQRAVLLAARFSRGMTLGVRIAALDAGGRVFLVRHTYVPGWHLPGGGVEPGETLIEAAAKELREEGNIVMAHPPVLHGMFFNRRALNRDHLAVYVTRQFHQTAPRPADHEIAETGFFPLDALPEGTTAATRRRLHEITAGLPAAPEW